MSASREIPAAAIDNDRRRRRSALGRMTLALVLLNVVWRSVRYGLAFPIWGDEAFVVMSLWLRDFAGLARPLEYGQIVPLGFMWAEHVVTRLVGFSELALRFLPYAAGVASMLLFWRLARRCLNRRSTFACVGFFAAAYYPVRHGTEVKAYSWDLCMALILLNLGWAVVKKPRSVTRWIGLIAAAALGVWLSYPSVFVAGGVGLVLICVFVRRPTGRTVALSVAYGLLVATSFAAMFMVTAGPHATVAWAPGSPETIAEWGRGFPFVRPLWQFPLWLLDVHAGNMSAYPVGGKHGGSTATFLLAIVGAVGLWKRNRLLLLMLLGPLVFTFFAACLQRYPYGSSARFSLHMAPTVCLLAGIGLSLVLKRWVPARLGPTAIYIAFVVFAVIASIGVGRDILKPYKHINDEENRRTIQWLADRSGPDDLWVSYNSLDHDVDYADCLFTRGGSGARHRFYMSRYARGPIEWAPTPESVVAPERGTVWLVILQDNRKPFDESLLESYVAQIAAVHGTPVRHEFPLPHKKYEMKMTILEFPRAK